MEERRTENVLALIDELMSSVEASKKLPLTNKVVLDQDDLLDLLERLRDEIPDEITQARWLLRDRDKVVVQARTEAERILREAAARAEDLARENAITEAARKHADEIVDQARQVAREIRLSANEYTDGLLLKAQETMASALRAIEAARSELRSQAAATRSSERAGTRTAAAAKTGDGAGATTSDHETSG